MKQALLFLALLYVTNEREGSVMIVDTATNSVVARNVVGTRTRGLVFSPDGKRLYIAVSHFKGKPWIGPDEVVAVDAATLKIVRHYKSGTDPEGIALSHRRPPS